MPITLATWVTRETTTLRHLRGIVESLDARGAVSLSQIKIMVVPDNLSSGVVLDGSLFPNGEGRIVTADNLPAEGLLFIPEST